jgi:hypothetical protein
LTNACVSLPFSSSKRRTMSNQLLTISYIFLPNTLDRQYIPSSTHEHLPTEPQCCDTPRKICSEVREQGNDLYDCCYQCSQCRADLYISSTFLQREKEGDLLRQQRITLSRENQSMPKRMGFALMSRCVSSLTISGILTRTMRTYDSEDHVELRNPA